MKELDQRILEDVEPVLEGMGYFPVEVRAVIQKTGPKVYIVITKKGGVNIEDTAQVLQILRPRIQLLLEHPEVSLEVSSPGIDRVLKSSREFRGFSGRGVKVLPVGKTEWIGGIILSVQEDTLKLQTRNGEYSIPLKQIKKAKLDYTEEVGKSYGV